LKSWCYISLLFGLLVVSGMNLNAQNEDSSWLKDHVSLNGYVKWLHSASFADGTDLLTHNFLHNRLNLKGQFGNHITATVEVRNRFFYGETVRFNPGFGEMVDIDNGLVDMSVLLLDERTAVFHTIVDRAYLTYNYKNWEIDVGRQRVNWGINLAWNPNDLFNAYNLVDFDYQERPGSDAVRIQHYGANSLTEVAIRPGESLDEMVIGALYKFYKVGYDFQVIAANYYTDLALGLGWAGNIKNAGFKGEATYFQPRSSLQQEGALSASMTFDYAFKNGVYVNVAGLYNTLGSSEGFGLNTTQFTSGTLSAKNLMPSKVSSFVQVSAPLNSAISTSGAVIFLHGMDILFIMPSLAASISNDWDVDLTGQLFFGDYDGAFQNIGNSVFLRFRWSF
jgi:hypothetical protein